MDEAYMEDDKDEVDEEINLDELMAELEEVSNEDTVSEEDEKDEDMKEGIGDKIAGTLKGIGKSFNLLSTPDETARDLRKSLLKNPELKNDEKFMSMLKAVEAFAGAAAGAGSARRAEGVEENFDIDALVAEIESSLDEDTNEDTVDEGATGYDEKVGGKGRTGFDNKVGGKGGTGYDGAVKKLEEERDEALETVASLQETISEMNLLNSKLLYCNKLFRANALTEAQKVKVVDALDMANTTNEAKLVFSTLQESFNFTGVEKRAIKEGLGRASKASGTAPKKVITESVDETVSRFQKLANIKF
jgi:hypothetical protein